MSQNSQSKNFPFQWQNSVTEVSVFFWPPCWCPSEGHQHGLSIQSSINLGETFYRITQQWKTAQTSISTMFFCLSIIHHIPDSWLNLLNGYDFYFRCKPPIPFWHENLSTTGAVRIRAAKGAFLELYFVSQGFIAVFELFSMEPVKEVLCQELNRLKIDRWGWENMCSAQTITANK